MIIVVGVLQSAPGPEGAHGAGGRAAAIARAAVRDGATVQLVGKIGDDPPGDLALLSLAADGIGHAAVLRDASHPTARAETTVESAGAGQASLEVGPVEVMVEVEGDGEAEVDGEFDGQVEPAIESGVEGARGSESAAFDAQDLELALRYLPDFRVLVLADDLADDGRRVATEAASFSSAHLVAVLPTGAEPPAYEPLTALEAPESDAGDEFAALVGRYAAALDGGASPEAAFRRATGGTGWEHAEGA